MFESIQAAANQLKEMLGVKKVEPERVKFSDHATPYRYDHLVAQDPSDTKPILQSTDPSIETSKAVPLTEEQRRMNAAMGLTRNRG